MGHVVYDATHSVYNHNNSVRNNMLAMSLHACCQNYRASLLIFGALMIEVAPGIRALYRSRDWEIRIVPVHVMMTACINC
eukprot:COSAG02_NODE_452_length_22047_cov_20.154502_12_plen_80_part_00